MFVAQVISAAVFPPSRSPGEDEESMGRSAVKTMRCLMNLTPGKIANSFMALGSRKLVVLYSVIVVDLPCHIPVSELVV